MTETLAPQPNTLATTVPVPEAFAEQALPAENDIGRKTAALVLGMEAVGLVVDGGLKVASAYLPALEGLATRELIAGGGDMAVISKLDRTHDNQGETVPLTRRERIGKRLGSTALMVGTAYTSARLGVGAAEAAGVRSSLGLFGAQVASKAAGLGGVNILRSRRQSKKNTSIHPS